MQARLFPPPPPSKVARLEPDWAGAHRELARKHVPRGLLWQEYKAEHPDGYRCSAFCQRYRKWSGKLSVSKRQTHPPGEKLFVDYAGSTLPVIDPDTGDIRLTQLFVAVPGASNYTDAEATWTQSLPDWLGAPARALEFMGGAPGVVVSGNLKSGVKKPNWYEPDTNPSYQEWASRYGVAVLPARVRKSKDKAKAEVGVQIAKGMLQGSARGRSSRRCCTL